MYAGVKDARMLDGGFAEWGRHGGELAASPAMPVPATRFNESGAVRCELLASSDEVGSVSRAEARGVVVRPFCDISVPADGERRGGISTRRCLKMRPTETFPTLPSDSI